MLFNDGKTGKKQKGTFRIRAKLPDSRQRLSLPRSKQDTSSSSSRVLNKELVEQGLTSHSTQFRSFRRRCFYGWDDPTNSN